MAATPAGSERLFGVALNSVVAAVELDTRQLVMSLKSSGFFGQAKLCRSTEEADLKAMQSEG